MDESQLIILAFSCNWSVSYGLRLKISVVDSTNGCFPFDDTSRYKCHSIFVTL